MRNYKYFSRCVVVCSQFYGKHAEQKHLYYMFKVFSLFIIKFYYKDNNILKGIRIIMFFYNGLYNKNTKASLMLKNSVLLGLITGLSIIKLFLHLIGYYFQYYLTNERKNSMIFCALLTCMTSYIQHVMIFLLLKVLYHLQVCRQHMC